MEPIPFNLNDYLLVKLTREGYKLLAEDHNRYSDLSFFRDPDSFAAEADENGYTKMQTWKFMNLFGSKSYIGGPHIYDTNILLLPASTSVPA
ncbi:hypothetical protein CLV58_12519 [Spirosoma oryzae]|uniref:Uncharacterized protein n=1 Tax=Spirosoma oryzae TaxID=1469603 RepID=A0A2T0S8J6_9BACT|nr:hypothetical protein [Spirosoma oryzae]PRY29757.1 hypothetical protein CLV58_12519 [Spirosoma oryzae]